LCRARARRYASPMASARTRTSVLSWARRRRAGQKALQSRKRLRPRGMEDLIIVPQRAPLEEASKRATNSMVCADLAQVMACPRLVLRAASGELSRLSLHSQHAAASSCLPQLRCAARVGDPNGTGDACSFPQHSAPDQRSEAADGYNRQKPAAPRAQTSLRVASP
jgi:hypothetical protein